MNSSLFLIPLLTAISAVVLYRHNGKKEILKFDLVQFLYAFVLFPILFIWTKVFVFVLFKNQLFIYLSAGQLFVADTVLSTLFLYIYAFIVIHSLTKSFDLKRKFDPLYDLFQHSEYFHLWLSHVVIFIGIMLLMCVIAFLNITIPSHFTASFPIFLAILFSATIVGIAFFYSIMYSYNASHPYFMKLMKLLFGVFFLAYMLVYFIFSPTFSIDYVFYWYTFMIFMTLIGLSFSQRSQKAKRLFRDRKSVV